MKLNTQKSLKCLKHDPTPSKNSPPKQILSTLLPHFKLTEKKRNSLNFIQSPSAQYNSIKFSLKKMPNSGNNSLILPEMEPNSSFKIPSKFETKNNQIFGQRHASLGRNENHIISYKSMTSKTFNKAKILDILSDCQKLIKNKNENKEEKNIWAESMLEKINKKSILDVRVIRDIINRKIKERYKRDLNSIKKPQDMQDYGENKLTQEEKDELELKKFKVQKVEKICNILKVFDCVDEELKKERINLDHIISVGNPNNDEEFYYKPEYCFLENKEEFRKNFKSKVKNYYNEADFIHSCVFFYKLY